MIQSGVVGARLITNSKGSTLIALSQCYLKHCYLKGPIPSLKKIR